MKIFYLNYGEERSGRITHASDDGSIIFFVTPEGKRRWLHRESILRFE